MKRLNSQKGITLIALIVTIIVLIIIAGISIATLTADNGVLRQTNLAKVENIEGTAREQVKLGCSAMRLAIAEAQALDNSYKASDNRDKIRDVLLNTIKADTTALEKDGWSSANDTAANVFKITYAGDDYKQACNDDNAEIVYTITLGQKSIEITNETNATLKDQNGNDVNLDIGGNTGSGSGSGSGSGDAEDPDDGGSTEPVVLAAGLYDANNQLVASWDELVNTYGMDVTKNYTYSTYNTDTASPYYVLTNNPELTNGVKLIIDNDVTTVGNYAFMNCTSLTSVTFPDSITSIRSSAFQGCTGLTSIEIPDGVTAIYNSTFYDCTSLTSVTIPSSVKTFGYAAFCCKNLKTIYYEGTIEQWCNIYFDRDTAHPCYSNSAELYIDGELADDIVIPNTVTEINQYAFYNYKNLKSVTIPNSVATINKSAFEQCTNLTNITFGENSQLAKIGEKTFANCANLKAIVVPDGVQIIEHGAFYYCKSLETITIPDSVTTFKYLRNNSNYTFSGCTNLKTVYYEGTVEQWCDITFEYSYSNPCYNGAALYIDGNLIENLIVPDTITQVKNYTFYKCASIKNVTIPDGVVTISEGAFSYCANLESVTIADSVTTVAGFDGCTSLKNVTFGENSQLLNIKGFGGCTSLESITIPDGVTTIGNSAFKSCTNLKTITIPSSVTSIDGYVFESCTRLTTVYYEGTVEQWCSITYGNYTSHPFNNINVKPAFYINGELADDITIPDTVTEIKSKAFYNVNSLTSVTISDGVTSIGSKAFQYCANLTNVIVLATEPPTVSDAFYYCYNLTTITVPAGCGDTYKAASGWSSYASKIVEAQ